MIADMFSNKKLTPIVTESFIRGKKLNISLAFITQFFLLRQKYEGNSLHYFIMKIPTRTSTNYIYESLQHIYCKTILFLVTNTTLASDNSLGFRKNLLERI